MSGISHGVTTSFTHEGETPVTGSTTYTAPEYVEASETVPKNTTAHEIDIVVTASQLTTIFMLADQDLTVKTYASAVLKQTINLKANTPYCWQSDGYFSCPISDSFDKVKIDNATGTDATFQFRALIDSTP